MTPELDTFLTRASGIKQCVEIACVHRSVHDRLATDSGRRGAKKDALASLADARDRLDALIRDLSEP